VLYTLSLQIKEGKSLAILGQSGGGKLSLPSLMSGLDKPEFGTITLDGQVITKLSQDQLSQFRSEKPARRITVKFASLKSILWLFSIFAWSPSRFRGKFFALSVYFQLGAEFPLAASRDDSSCRHHFLTHPCRILH
jgi:energy-coupling factor transporter ATP-binding protein EcfA2